MTKEDFFKQRDIFKQDYETGHAKAKALYDSGETDLSAYDMAFMLSEKTKLYHLRGLTIDKVIKELDEAKEYIEATQIPDNRDLCYEIEVDSYYDSAAVESAAVESEGFQLKEWRVVSFNKESWKSRVRHWFNEELRPNQNGIVREVECNLMDLFKDGTLDFKTLQKTVYSDCGL